MKSVWMTAMGFLLSAFFLFGCDSGPASVEQAREDLKEAQREALDIVKEAENEAADDIAEAQREAKNDVIEAEKKAQETVANARRDLNKAIETSRGNIVEAQKDLSQGGEQEYEASVPEQPTEDR